MKLLVFKGAKGKHTFYHNVIWLETEEEQDCYKWTHAKHETYGTPFSETKLAYREGYWGCYMTEKLDTDMNEESVLHYFMPNDLVPRVGEVWQLYKLDIALKRVE